MASSSPPRNAPFGEWKTPKCAEIRALGRIKGLSIRRIAEVTGVPRSSVCRVPDVRERRVMEGAISSANGNFVTSYVVYGLIGVLAAYRSYLLQRNAISKASKSTIQRVLAKAGYHRCVACPRPFINKKQQNKRLKFAQEHIDLDEDVLR